jgi:hypothetical protein
MIVSKQSQFIAMLILFGTPLLIGCFFVEDANNSVVMNMIGMLALHIAAGHLICVWNDAEPEWSEKVKNDELDVWWGLYCYWYFMFWPNYVLHKD